MLCLADGFYNPAGLPKFYEAFAGARESVNTMLPGARVCSLGGVSASLVVSCLKGAA